MRPTPLDYARLAIGHWAASRNESQEAQVALAFFIRNLFTIARLTSEEICAHLWVLAPSLEECNEGYLAARDIMVAKPSLEHLRSAFVSRSIDPTGGALRAHRHDENPAWADRSWPTSLIGPWIFYRALDA